MIYVDNARIKKTVHTIHGRWSHLFQYPPSEPAFQFVQFAMRLGLKLKWLQSGTSRHYGHFDVTESKRQQAIKMGAISISWREAAKLLRKEK
jgi:hypothetical protein